MIEAIFFYVFSAVLLGSAALVVTARNPVHAVLCLILAFFNAAGLFVMLGAEFLAMTLVIVYVGAVAVLFLFIVMMLDIDFAALRAGMKKNLPAGLLVGGVLLGELGWLAFMWKKNPYAEGYTAAPMPEGTTNAHALGEILYTHYVLLFEACGLILLVAMIGAIVLTLSHRTGVKRQDPGAQSARTPETAIEVVKVKTGEGV
jgi:NADH-quinone oxidoreductase subunit J